MNSHIILKTVLNQFPELKKFGKVLPIESAIKFAIELACEETESMDASPAERLHALRLEHEMSQLELAILAGTSQGNLSAIENGQRPLGIKTAKRFAKIFDCDFRELI